MIQWMHQYFFIFVVVVKNLNAGHHIGIGKPPKRVAVEIKCVGLFKVLRDGVLLLVLLTKWH